MNTCMFLLVNCGRLDPSAHVSAASISMIVCDVVDKVDLVLSCVKDREHSVKTIVLMETPSADLVNRGQQAGIHILSLQEMEVSRHILYTSLFSFIPFFVFFFIHSLYFLFIFLFFSLQIFCIVVLCLLPFFFLLLFKFILFVFLLIFFLFSPFQLSHF